MAPNDLMKKITLRSSITYIVSYIFWWVERVHMAWLSHLSMNRTLPSEALSLRSAALAEPLFKRKHILVDQGLRDGVPLLLHHRTSWSVGPRSLTNRWMFAQRFSIGFRSGLRAGHSSVTIPLVRRYAMFVCAMCTLAPSCMNTGSRHTHRFQKIGPAGQNVKNTRFPTSQNVKKRAQNRKRGQEVEGKSRQHPKNHQKRGMFFSFQKRTECYGPK